MTSRIEAARGTELRCRGWRQEALLRMLENVLEVGERPEDLIVYASLGKAARDWESYHAIREALLTLEEKETLILQSGRPVAIFPTSADAPLVLTATNNFVGRFATPEIFYEKEREGLTMWGGLTAGAWQYIGSQGVLQGCYEVLMAAARGSLGGSLEGRFVLTSGLGGMGRAQPTAIRMAGAVGIVVEVDPVRLQRSAGVLDEVTDSLDTAIESARIAQANGKAWVIGLQANAADVYAEFASRRLVPDVVTDMTAAHDARFGYVPTGLGVEEWNELRAKDPESLEALALASMAQEVRAMLRLRDMGAVVFENGNNLRSQAERGGVKEAFELSGFAEAYLRPLFSRGIGPFRWVALSGSEEDLELLDRLAMDLFIERPEVAQWILLARSHVSTQGLAARSCWLGHAERSRMALATNALVASGELSAPVLFTRDHLDAASMTNPYIGTERMRDGSDAVSDWPLLDAMLMCSTGADLVAIHAGGGGYSGLMQSSGVSIVADGAQSTAPRLLRALDADTGLGVSRYADAGYDVAVETAATAKIRRIMPSGTSRRDLPA